MSETASPERDRLIRTVRSLLADRTDVVEKGVVGGGHGFMVSGNLCCSVTARGLTVRVGATAKSELVRREHVTPLVFGKREAAAFVVVGYEALTDERQVGEWVEIALAFVSTLPAKT